MKKYDKGNLVYADGYIFTKKGKVVCVKNEIVDLANKLEEVYQMAMYLNAQPKAQPMPTLNGFERISNFNIKPGFIAETPMLDKKAEEALKIMDELDNAEHACNLNDKIAEFKELIWFAMNDGVYDVDVTPKQFDTPLLGNPLEYTEDLIVSALAYIEGYNDDEK